MSIIISDLAYHYPNQDYLFERIGFSIGKQEKMAIVGNNGVGKSTLLRLLAGELLPSEGSIIYDATPYYIPQHTGLLHKTVAEVLHITPHTLIDGLSGGEKTKVFLAGLLIHMPEYILLDEPTNQLRHSQYADSDADHQELPRQLAGYLARQIFCPRDFAYLFCNSWLIKQQQNKTHWRN